MSKELVRLHNSKVPDVFEDLIKLAGVGRKTANVFLNCAHGVHTIAVDTHVLRVSYRIGLSNSKSPDKVEQDLLKIVPKKYLKDAHHLLILHGRYVCVARKPKCDNCLINKLCLKRIESK